MKQQLQFELQAWVDGELSEKDARRVAQFASEDPAARALVSELRATKSALQHAEMARAVSDSREFYWSKIQRQISAEAKRTAHEPSPWLAFWRRLALPMTAVAAAACVVLVAVKPPPASVASPYDEITATSDAMDTMTYHDQATGLTVVWLQDKASAPTASATAVQDDNSVDTD